MNGFGETSHGWATRVCLLSVLTTAALTIGFAQVASAGAIRLVINTPQKGDVVAGSIPINEHLSEEGKNYIEKVRFYLNDERVRSITKPPWKTKDTLRFDTNTLPEGQNTLRFAMEYTKSYPSGKVKTYWAKHTRNIVVDRPDPPPTVPIPPPGPSPAPDDSKIVFDDEFDSNAAFPYNWNLFRKDWIIGRRPYNNHEGAGYRAENVSVKDGTLQLKTSDDGFGPYPMSTGAVNSNAKFDIKYGYIEARIWVPSCDQCWPAFWFLPKREVWPPEFDVIEFFDTSTATYPWTSNHWPADDEDLQEYDSRPFFNNVAEDYRNSWHTYGVYWTPTMMQSYLDRVPGPIFNAPGTIPQEEMYVLLQLAIGTGGNPPPGQTMKIDYVRAWQEK